MLVGPFPHTSNKADWIESVGLYDADADEALDISTATEIVIEVKRGAGSASLLSGTLTGGEIELIETGVFQFSFPASQMSALDPGTYDVYCRITKDDTTAQLIIGTLPVVSG